MRHASFRLNARVFSVFLVVGLLMLVAASYFVIGVGQAGLRSAWGDQLRQVADQTAAAVDTYVFRLVIDASVLSHVPEVREAAASGSKRPFERAAALSTDHDWERAGAAVPEKKAVIDSKVSAFLTDTTRQNPIYRELLLTDRYGRVVAASGPTDGYLMEGTPWWQESFGDGTRGHLTVSDVRFNPLTRTFEMAITAPVDDEAGGQLTGILRTVVNVRDIGAILGGVRMGASGEAVLVRQDGSIVFAPGSVDPNARFFAADLLGERLAAARNGQPLAPLHFGASTAGGTPRLVGVAFSQLKASFPHLNWAVAVSQDEDELFRPVRSQGTSLVIVIGLTALAVLLFALWYSVCLSALPEPEEMDMHLTRHPRLHRIAESEEAEESEQTEESNKGTAQGE
jgi:C4-dicarboxylate-specific signal transduction histidine kinase